MDHIGPGNDVHRGSYLERLVVGKGRILSLVFDSVKGQMLCLTLKKQSPEPCPGGMDLKK